MPGLALLGPGGAVAVAGGGGGEEGECFGEEGCEEEGG